MTTSTGPLDETWGFGDLLTIGGAVLAVPIGAPLVLVSVGDTATAGLVGAAASAIPLGYESDLIPHLKWEVRRRARPTELVEPELEPAPGQED